MISTALVALDSTILAASVPTIVGDVGGFDQYPWLFSAYMLTSAVTVPLHAKLADTLGRRPLLLWGIGVFMVGSVLCACAWSMPVLILARAVQGIGAGAVQPLATTVMGDLYTLEERARTQGYIAGVWAVSAMSGPLIGAALSQAGLWRWVFLVNTPLCLLAAWLVMRHHHERLTRHAHRIDYAGAATLAVGAALFLVWLSEGGKAWPWWSVASLAVLVGSLVLLTAFVLIERRAAEPVLSLGILAHRFLGPAAVVNFAISGCMIGLTAFVPTYLEIGAGISPVVSGLALAGFSIGWPTAGFLSGAFYLRRGFRATAILGGAVAVLGATALVTTAAWPNPWCIAAVCFVIGFGVGSAAVPTLVGAQSSVGWAQRGVASGLIMFSRSLGQAVGVAVLGAVFSTSIRWAGGDASDPGTVVVAGRWVFVGSLVLAAVVLVGSWRLPRRVAEEGQEAQARVA